uniref:CARD domain-containing protein n=1 Tax=Plectus sambesii TaxID=2011161 RepID=A0A914VRP0_9BILA
MNTEHRNALQASLHEICQDLDAEDALPYLRAKGIVQEGQAQEILAIPRKSTQNMKLVTIVQTAGPRAFEEFINALRTCNKAYLVERIMAHLPPTSTQQTHTLSKTIERDMNSEFSDDSLNRECLTTCLPFLCDRMIVDEVVIRLQANKILTSHEADLIRVKKTRLEKNQRLIDFVQQRGPEAFSCFMKSLTETGQNYLFDKLIEERKKIAKRKNLSVRDTARATSNAATTSDSPNSDIQSRDSLGDTQTNDVAKRDDSTNNLNDATEQP